MVTALTTLFPQKHLQLFLAFRHFFNRLVVLHTTIISEQRDLFLTETCAYIGTLVKMLNKLYNSQQFTPGGTITPFSPLFKYMLVFESSLYSHYAN